MSNEMQQPQYLKSFVRGIYAIQKLRIQSGNRIVAEFRVEHGQNPGEKSEVLDDEGKTIIQECIQSCKRLTDGLVKFPTVKSFKGDKIISNYAMLALVSSYIQLLDQEETQFKLLAKILEFYPIWTNFMKDVRGCGPAMAAIIISEIDIHKATYPSSIFKYAGLDVVETNKDGAVVPEGRSRRKAHLVKRTYTKSDGTEAERDSITFNPFLKTKLIGVLGSSFIKQPADKCKYRKIYDDYKNRLVNHPAHAEKTKMHRHNMAVRYMVKLFLVDLYGEWRKLEGLPNHGTYYESKLGGIHGSGRDTQAA